jgi:CDP-glucose 4,6-dehydratase
MEHPAVHGQAFNFNNEIQKTVLELTRETLEVMGSDLEPDVLGVAWYREHCAQ